MSFRPLLGAKVESIHELRYPLFASYKLDGIRAGWEYKEFLSRTRKTVPNRNLQKLAASLGIPSGYDGELIVGEPNAPDVYRKTNSYCMSQNGTTSEQVRFFVFDNYESNGEFADRYAALEERVPFVVRLDQTLVSSSDELAAFEDVAVGAGYEGVVLRSPTGRYKQGRSTLREQFLLKLKRFTDAEATIVGFEELQRNFNEAELDERGYAKRSSHQAGKLAGGVLGALVCEYQGLTFRIGTGFSASERQQIWRDRDKYLGKLVKFKSFPIGVKDLPRHPVFLGFRDKIDL
jgi:DNA ligase-1